MALASFEKIFEKSPNAYMLVDKNYRFVAANQAYVELISRRREDIIGHDLFQIFPDDVTRRSHHQLRASFDRVFKTAQADILAWLPYRVPRRSPNDASERFWSATHTPILDDEGHVEFLLQHTVDISDLDKAGLSKEQLSHTQEASVIRRVQAVQEANSSLRNERRRLLKFFEQAPGFVAIISVPDYIFELANESFYELVGHRRLLERPLGEALPELISAASTDLLDKVANEGEPFVGRTTRLEFQATERRPLRTAFVDFVLQPVQEADGSISGILIQGNEITGRVIAEEELKRYQGQLEELVTARTEALRKSQAALQHAQKMEAVGRLTGGVAHDFNNLLQIIAGNLQLAQRDQRKDGVNERRLQNALNAVDRGARLASQLLAFARRQALEPQVIHPGKLVEGLNDLLRQAVGATIKTETVISKDLWNTFCDPSQLENAILNLAINAHDAMDGKGKLTIELSNAHLDEAYTSRHDDLPAGDYVALAISDTGCGMPPHVVKQVFEPFFSTKAPDRGTGLGLSMVYGFVKQTGGHINIYSEEGIGTSVKIYFPRSLRDLAQQSPLRIAPVTGGNETILIVEDDDEVRETAAELLDDLGYRILRAADPASGLAILESGIPIDLLFTDVVMPGSLTATELARRSQILWPKCQVLFTSGYTENAVANTGQVAPGTKLIGKPYRQEDLARKIRQLLDDNRRHSRSDSGDQALRILVVEDAVDVRHALAAFLGSVGHQVVELGTAEAALDALSESSFEVLVTDVSLPGLSGLELATQVERQHPDMAIIIASGYDAPPDDDPMPRNYRWLQKPYDFSQVETALADIRASSSAGAGS